jgi:hypothetical protein
VILKLALTHPLALALSQSYVQTFDDFRTIDVDDVHEFKYTLATDPKDHQGTTYGRQENSTLCLINLLTLD